MIILCVHCSEKLSVDSVKRFTVRKLESPVHMNLFWLLRQAFIALICQVKGLKCVHCTAASLGSTTALWWLQVEDANTMAARRLKKGTAGLDSTTFSFFPYLCFLDNQASWEIKIVVFKTKKFVKNFWFEITGIWSLSLSLHATLHEL